MAVSRNQQQIDELAILLLKVSISEGSSDSRPNHRPAWSPVAGNGGATWLQVHHQQGFAVGGAGARGTSHLTGALKSDDTRHMADALRAMGVMVDEPDATRFIVTGTGRLRAPVAPLFLGNAGTATRFLTAAAALADGLVVVTGDAHMQRRPISPLVAALRL